jgi:hypothetical protein
MVFSSLKQGTTRDSILGGSIFFPENHKLAENIVNANNKYINKKFCGFLGKEIEMRQNGY